MEELSPWVTNDQQQKQNYARRNLKKHEFSLRYGESLKNYIEKLPMLRTKKNQSQIKQRHKTFNEKLKQFEEQIIIKKHAYSNSSYRQQRAGFKMLKTNSVNMSNHFNLQYRHQYSWDSESINYAKFKIKKQLGQSNSMVIQGLNSSVFEKYSIKKSQQLQKQQYRAHKSLQRINTNTLTKFNLFKKKQKRIYAFN